MKKDMRLVNRPIPPKQDFHSEELSMIRLELAIQDKYNLYFR